MCPLLKYITAVLGLFFCFSSCTKDDNNEPKTTSLEITIKDENGQFVTQNCYVKLYGTVEDLTNQQDLGAIGEPQFTDAEGKVLFSNLNPQKYYWKIQKSGNGNCVKNNFNDTYSDLGLISPLTEGIKTQVTTNVSPKGSFDITNHTGNTCRLYINNVFAEDVINNGAYSQINKKTGAYTVRMVVTSTAKDSTFTMQVNCGETTPVFLNP